MKIPSLPRNGTRKVQKPANRYVRNHTIIPSIMGLFLQLNRFAWKPINRLPAPLLRPAVIKCAINTPSPESFKLRPPRQPWLLRWEPTSPSSSKRKSGATQEVGRGRAENKKHQIFSHLPPLKNQALFGNVCCPFSNKTSDLRAREIKSPACLDSTGSRTS